MRILEGSTQEHTQKAARVHFPLETHLCNLKTIPQTDLARIYARSRFQVKELACEFIVIHGQCNLVTWD